MPGPRAKPLRRGKHLALPVARIERIDCGVEAGLLGRRRNVEEIGLTVLEKNKKSKKQILIELSLFYEEDSVLVIERDSGKLFDVTDPDLEIAGLSSLTLNGLMKSHTEKAYLVTTGYNRNMIRFRLDGGAAEVR